MAFFEFLAGPTQTLAIPAYERFPIFTLLVFRKIINNQNSVEMIYLVLQHE